MANTTYIYLLRADSVRWTCIAYASGTRGYRDAHRYGQIDDLVARQNASKRRDPWKELRQ